MTPSLLDRLLSRKALYTAFWVIGITMVTALIVFTANLQKDKVGLALAFNRIGFNHFKMSHFSESEHFHRKSQKLSEQQYLFAAGYNLGIDQPAAEGYSLCAWIRENHPFGLLLPNLDDSSCRTVTHRSIRKDEGRNANSVRVCVVTCPSIRNL